MKPTSHTSVRIANTTIEVPIVVDEPTTERIASQVEQHFRQLEEQSTRIDSQRFALMSAFYFAAAHHQAEMKAADDERALLSALDALNEKLHTMAQAAAAIAGE